MSKYKLYHYDGYNLIKNAVKGVNFEFSSLDEVHRWINDYVRLGKKVPRKQFVIVEYEKFNSKIVEVVNVDDLK